MDIPSLVWSYTAVKLYGSVLEGVGQVPLLAVSFVRAVDNVVGVIYHESRLPEKLGAHRNNNQHFEC